MINRLKKIYGDKIILNVTEFDYNKYYYFYSGNGDIFGIEKTIGNNEYELLIGTYLEKKVYDNNQSKQKIFEYLFELKSYPFKKNVQLILIEVENNNQQNDNLIYDLFDSLYQSVEMIRIDNLLVIFGSEKIELNLKNILTPFIDDTGINMKVHEGIYINSKFNGTVVSNYISLIKSFFQKNYDLYTDIADPIFSSVSEEYISFIMYYILDDQLKDSLMYDLIITYFKNDLNVSKTSKDLYLNRNSLLNKFDIFYRKTGFNLQSFKHSSALYTILKYTK